MSFLHIVLFSIFFTINVGIGAYFVYYKYMNRNKENVYHVENYLIENGRSKTNKYYKSNFLFLQ